MVQRFSPLLAHPGTHLWRWEPTHKVSFCPLLCLSQSLSCFCHCAWILQVAIEQTSSQLSCLCLQAHFRRAGIRYVLLRLTFLCCSWGSELREASDLQGKCSHPPSHLLGLILTCSLDTMVFRRSGVYIIFVMTTIIFENKMWTFLFDSKRCYQSIQQVCQLPYEEAWRNRLLIFITKIC